MVALVAADVTYTVTDQSIADGSGNRQNSFDLVFGDGALTYPTGGVPMAKALFGCPNVIKRFNFTEASATDGYVYKYDVSTEKMLMYYVELTSATPDAPLIEAANTETPAATTLKVDVEGF